MNKKYFNYILFIILYMAGFVSLGQIDVFAKNEPSSKTESFSQYKDSNEAVHYLQIVNSKGDTVSLAKHVIFNTLQSKSGIAVGCGADGSEKASDICYYNKKGVGFQTTAKLTKTGAKVDDKGRTIFNSVLYGKERGKQLRLYLPITQDKYMDTDSLAQTYANIYMGESGAASNFKYYGMTGTAEGLGYRWWKLKYKNGSTRPNTYCYYTTKRICTTWGKRGSSLTPAEIRADVKNHPNYISGYGKNAAGETGEYRFLGYSSFANLTHNPFHPDDYPSTLGLKDYPFRSDEDAFKWLNDNGFAIAPTNIDKNHDLKTQALKLVLEKRGISPTSKNIEHYRPRLTIAGNPNYDPIVASGANTNYENYFATGIPTTEEAARILSVAEIKVCKGEITDISQCQAVGSWKANGNNFYFNKQYKAEGTQKLVIGERYTVFTKLHNGSLENTKLKGQAMAGHSGGVDGSNLKINGAPMFNSQGTTIAANKDSQWIPNKPFTAGVNTVGGSEVVVAGVSEAHVKAGDDNDRNDNYGAIKFGVVAPGNMEIISIKAYEKADIGRKKQVTKLENGKEYTFVVDTKFTPNTQGWKSKDKILMPMNVVINRVFTDGSSEQSKQVTFPEKNAYQTLEAKHYEYIIHGAAGMPGTDITVTAEFDKSNSGAFNDIINGKDKITAKYQVPTINGNVAADSLISLNPIAFIDKNGTEYELRNNVIDTSKTYKIVYETLYNGDIISKKSAPITTSYSCYYSNVTSSSAKIACNGVSGLVPDGVVKSAYVTVNGAKYNLTKSGNTWYSATVNHTGTKTIKLYVNDSHKGTYTHNLSSPVYRGGGYPTVKNVQTYSIMKDTATGKSREVKAYFDLKFEDVAKSNGKNVSFKAITKTYYGLPGFNRKIYYETDRINTATNARFDYIDINDNYQKTRVNSLNTNPNDDYFNYENNVNINLEKVTVYPGNQEILGKEETDGNGNTIIVPETCPVYEVRYNIHVSENDITKNSQGLVTVKITFGGRTYTFKDYLIEGDNNGISHILNNVDCNKVIKDGTALVEINPINEVKETTKADNKKQDIAKIKVIPPKDKITENDKMDVWKDIQYKCSETDNTYSWKTKHTVRNWKEVKLGDIPYADGYTSVTKEESLNYEEHYRIVQALFSSKDTDWKPINILNRNAKIKAGYGFTLSTVVEYESNILANNVSLGNVNNGNKNGIQASHLNIEPYLPGVMYAKYDGVTYPLYVISTTVKNGKVTKTYAYTGTYNGKPTNKIYVDENTPDGEKTIELSTPRIIGSPTKKLGVCLRDNKNAKFIVEGSMYDDMDSSITQ